jgi:hypothetical protein
MQAHRQLLPDEDAQARANVRSASGTEAAYSPAVVETIDAIRIATDVMPLLEADCSYALIQQKCAPPQVVGLYVTSVRLETSCKWLNRCRWYCSGPLMRESDDD